MMAKRSPVSKPRATVSRDRNQKKLAYVLFRISVWLLVAVVVLAITIVVTDEIIVPSQPVAEILMRDGSTQSITTRQFRDRVIAERVWYLDRRQAAEIEAKNAAERRTGMPQIPNSGNELDNVSESPLGFAAAIITRMTDEFLMEEEAARRGIIIDEKQVDDYIATRYGKLPISESGPEASPQQGRTGTETQESDIRRLTAVGVDTEVFRRVMALQVLEQELDKAFLIEIPANQDRVSLNLIRFESKIDADSQASAPLTGETFMEMYRQGVEGRVKGAYATGLAEVSESELERDFNESFAEAVFALEPGGLFDRPIPASNGWYIVQATARGTMLMSEEWRKQRARDAFVDWLAKQQIRVTQFPVWMERVPTFSESGR